jgi:putative methionine-R-sulfoxide reductase with GAF domain
VIGESKVVEKSIITEIKQRIRLLNAIAAFIIFIFLAVILKYLFKPVSEVLDFLPDVSITIIILMVLGLAGIGFYMWGLVSRQIIRSIEKYSSSLDHVLAVTKDLREEIYGDILLGKIMDYSLSITNSDAGSILLIEDNKLVFKIVKGEKITELMGTAIPKNTGIAGWVAENGRPLLITDVSEDKRFNPDIDAVTGYQTKSVLCVPLMTGKGVIGVIELMNKKDDFYTKRDEEIVAYLADQAAISIARAKFYEDQKNYEIHLTDILLEAMDSQIPEMKGHPKRVAYYSNIMAKTINMSEEKRKRLYLACLMHDLGILKIKTEDKINPVEFKKHPVIGYEMIRPINFYADISPFVLYHHERYDGSGYPAKLKGEAIPLESRIIMIAEAFDTMISNTSYKVPMDFDSAIKELRRNAGTQFDPQLVEVFVNNMSREQLL